MGLGIPSMPHAEIGCRGLFHTPDYGGTVGAIKAEQMINSLVYSSFSLSPQLCGYVKMYFNVLDF